MPDTPPTSAAQTPCPEPQAQQVGSPAGGGSELRAHNSPPAVPGSAALIQVGWMLSPDLAAEFDVTPLSDDYLITLEQAEQDGGIKDEFSDRVIPIYRKADDA